jgi:quinol monooxygenase YgiN
MVELLTRPDTTGKRIDVVSPETRTISAISAEKDLEMYGTVARMRLKAGSEQALTRLTADYRKLNLPGFIDTYVYRMDADSNELYMAVLFTDKASYVANAQSPEQNARYQQMRALMSQDPEWHDGEVISGGR